MLKNIHCKLPTSADVLPESVHCVKGDYLYYHYTCDGVNDVVSMWARLNL